MQGSEVADALRLLREGEIRVEGRLVDASNATLFCAITLDGVDAACVYKPVAGERPLWDFPDGTLAGREVAAYLVSELTGWGIVPPTVLRDGPFGRGMCQLWVEAGDADAFVDIVPRGAVAAGWLPVLDALGGGGRPVTLAHLDDERLRRIAVLDAVINNADRKGGHLLPTDEGRIYGVDHGVCFNVENKLRTVLWGWAGQRLPAEDVAVLERVRAQLGEKPVARRLRRLLTEREIERTCGRVDRLLSKRTFPQPVEGWPAIPWPPF
ncbi:MAG: SCO1664 family protein [Actinomycetota bacterium]|nr:SCO1664 family protein [Actinomycetota bacterium]